MLAQTERCVRHVVASGSVLRHKGKLNLAWVAGVNSGQQRLAQMKRVFLDAAHPISEGGRLNSTEWLHAP